MSVRSYLPDAAAALVIAAALVVEALVTPGTGSLAYVAVLAGAVGMLYCRRYPPAGLAVLTVSMAGYAALVEPTPSAAFGVLGAVFLAARAGHRALAVLASALFLAGFLGIDLSTSPDRPAQEIIERTNLLMGWFVAANIVGLVSRQRKAYLAQVERRAAEAERTKEEAALRRAGEERLRIARELHDSLTHSISIIKLQAGVAVHLARKRGEEEPDALVAIQEASGEAMRELRATLELLRGDPGDSTDDEAAAAGGLDQVGELIEHARSAGLVAEVTVSGSPRAVPAAVDRAAYRIVQEALTNITRHARASAVSVRVGYLAAELTLRIDDDGAADADPEPGVGLLGMRERVNALGGTLHAAPRDGRGFEVHATLPLEDA